MYIDRVEFVDGRTNEPIVTPLDVLRAEMISSAEVEDRWKVEGHLGFFEKVYKVVVKPEFAGIVSGSIQ
jgi:hypothetical protein